MADMFRDSVIALIPKMRNYATALTGCRTSADDLVQDTLVRVWRFRNSYQEGSQLQAWVMKIMRNEFLSQRARRLPVIQNGDGEFEDLRTCEPDQEWRATYSQMLEALAQLPGGNREALLMTVALGFTCEEASDLLGCAAGTVKSRVSRAREQLMRLLNIPTEPAQLLHSPGGLAQC
ncbi:sigma-70 family RNA polymerase sigma factor [Phenylobacterium sp.]|uniref:sigma-70 family RNA polymerase sigma factor n=1 Tax=Phenylobacterium sp. TaxID=1871053 RepID=UPI0035B33A55